jgi:tetratricopeptide (TPR) repeat protein
MSFTVLLVVLALGPAVQERDALLRARELYNLHQYDAAIKAADEARLVPATADVARVILGRAHLERFRAGRDPADLAGARAALLRVDSAKLSPRDSLELIIGLGETLYFDGQFGAAAELFDIALAAQTPADSLGRDDLLDWWADSLDRYAFTGPSRTGVYGRMLRRMEHEVQRDTRSIAASYWLVVAVHGVGDLDRSWDAAIAAWVKAPAAHPRAVELRADLDRYVTEIIIPERARMSAPAEEEATRLAALRTEWEALKVQWSSP